VSDEKATKMASTVEDPLTEPGATEIDPAPPFQPTRIFYIQKKSLIRSSIHILDLTTALLETYNPQTGISPSFLAEAKKLVSSSPPPETIYILKSNLTSSHLTVTNRTGTHLASWESPILALGTTTISFPDGSSHSSHPIEVKPLGVGRRAESFVKDSVTYVWEMERFKTELKSLVKVVGEERKEVARYAQRAGWDREGVLWSMRGRWLGWWRF
jgi:hypothetical protein